MNQEPTRWAVALTGASGMRYGIRLLRALSGAPYIEIHAVISDGGLRVLHDEEGLKASQGAIAEKLFSHPDLRDIDAARRIIFHHVKDIGAPIASGSTRFAGMVVAPCSMSTLGAIAHGTGTNLVHRAADVTLKEGRRLILVPRETPLTAIHLENMLKLSRLGVVMLPAMPGFYHRPAAIEEVIDMIVMRILDQMGINVELLPRWDELCRREHCSPARGNNAVITVAGRSDAANREECDA
jgi:4-hydroxy-3-polyprenylbenzoate decarboxylase